MEEHLQPSCVCKDLVRKSWDVFHNVSLVHEETINSITNMQMTMKNEHVVFLVSL